MSEKENNELEDDFEVELLDESYKNLDLQGHLDEIKEQLEEAREAYGHIRDEVYNFCYRAKVLYMKNRAEEAMYILKEGLKYFSNNTELICHMGFACLAQESWECKNYFQRVLEINSKYPLAHYGLGLMELKLAENSEAAQRRYNLLMMYDPKLASILRERISKFLMRRR